MGLVVYYFTQLPSAGHHNATTRSTVNTAAGVVFAVLNTSPTLHGCTYDPDPTARLEHTAVRKVCTTFVSCFDTCKHTHSHKLQATSKPYNSAMEIKKILLG
jgi:hypothetical protein